jgi:hypothetical protein
MSLTNGLIHPGDKFINVQPTRGLRYSQVFVSPNLTRTALESYSAGEITWGFNGERYILIIWKRDIPVGASWTLDTSIGLNNPINLAIQPYTEVFITKDMKVLNPMYSSDWNRLSLTVSPFAPYNSAELIRTGTSNDFGAVVYNKPIANDWLRLNIQARTSISGNADMLWLGLITDPGVINNSTTNLITTSGIFGYADIWNNARGFAKITSGTINFIVNDFAGIDKTGRLSFNSLTFERESISSESIRVTGSVNGVNYTSAYQANALPITGESYLAVGAWSGGFNATMTVSDVSYHIEK